MTELIAILALCTSVLLLIVHDRNQVERRHGEISKLRSDFTQRKCTRAGRPFHIDAWVVLPDHMHCVITLPPGDDDFSNRIKAMKIRFVQALPPTEGRSLIRMAKGERGIWQRRFWEHAIRDEGDYARQPDYVHFNPVKHGYVSMVAHWPHSTFHRWVKTGAYPRDWGGEGMLDVAAGERRR